MWSACLASVAVRFARCCGTAPGRCARGLLAFALLALATLPTTGTLAAELTLQPEAEPALYTLPNARPDVGGIAPGMTEAQVGAVLAQSYPGISARSITAHVTYVQDGVTFRTKPLLAQIAVQRQSAAEQDELTVHFGLPTTQTPVLGIVRRMDFANSPAAPLVTRVLEQVLETYGPPSFKRVDAARGAVTVVWLFGGGKLRPCGIANAPCPYISAAFSIGRLDAYRTAVAAGHDLMIQVDLIAQPRDLSRVKIFKTTLADNRGAVETYEAAQRQIIALVEGRGREDQPAAGSPRP